MRRCLRVMMIGTIALTFICQIGVVMGQKYNSLTEAEKRVILNQGTESPYTGEYTNTKSSGLYICKQCNAPLYRSDDKFDSHCGWPSFDDEIEGAVLSRTDLDGSRTEITCNNCKAHLGHVFLNEGFTLKQTRHCVNSISLVLVPEGETLPEVIREDSKDMVMNSDSSMEIIYLASGCFWGTEFHLQKLEGVLETTVGYIGGTIIDPTYKEVCTGTTGHAEAVKVVFNPSVVSLDAVLKLYFETHDPTQVGGQGPDLGDQYRSEIFYTTPDQKRSSEAIIDILKDKGYKVVTALTEAPIFYSAEKYHQDYYDHKGTSPYCHIYKKKF